MGRQNGLSPFCPRKSAVSKEVFPDLPGSFRGQIQLPRLTWALFLLAAKRPGINMFMWHDSLPEILQNKAEQGQLGQVKWENGQYKLSQSKDKWEECQLTLSNVKNNGSFLVYVSYMHNPHIYNLSLSLSLPHVHLAQSKTRRNLRIAIPCRVIGFWTLSRRRAFQGDKGRS